MSGFRQEAYAQSIPLIKKLLFEEAKLTDEEWSVLRECWGCSRHGNLLGDAIQQAGADLFHTVRHIVSSPGFLSTHELWHTRRVRKHKVLAYRGCGALEVEEARRGDLFGPSWTLSKDVAEFFAGRCYDQGDQVVLTAHINIDAWLHTAEHELVSVWVDSTDIVNVSQYLKSNSASQRIDWEKPRPHLRPYMQIVQHQAR